MVSLCAALAAVLMFGALANADTNADAFVAHQVATKTFAADLEQVFHWSFPKKHVESTGWIRYQAPDLLVMVLTNPVKETVLVRGDDLYIKRGKDDWSHRLLATKNGKPTQNVQFLLGFFQNGCTNYTPLFDPTMTVTTNTMTIVLTPKHPLGMTPLRQVTNVLDWPAMDVRSMRIGLIWGSYITYGFQNIRRNQPVDEKVFEAPKLDQ